MTEATTMIDAPARSSTLAPTADTALKLAAQTWFATAVAGQWIFVYYIASFYGGAAVRGDLDAWNTKLPHGLIPGDTMGNVAVAVHLLLAVIITIGGPLQLLPRLRARFPVFHRWNGRIYLLTAVAISITGLHMVWTRGAVGDLSQHIAISINGVLVMLCAVMALRYALVRDTWTHRRWALRLFMVVSGVWFFRVGFMFWLLVNGGPVGFDPQTFQGPFLTFLAFAQYLVPLAVLEIYLRARDKAGAQHRLAVASILLVLTAAMGVGIFGATMGMWLPLL